MDAKYYSLKKLFLSYVFGYMPFALIGAILSLINVLPVRFNEHPYYGITGFIITILTVPVFAGVFGVLTWMYLNFGIFIGQLVFRILRIREEKNHDYHDPTI